MLSQLKEIIPPQRQTGYSWLYKDEDFAKVESEAKGENIWIISPDLSNVTRKQAIIDAVEKKHQKGNYLYLHRPEFKRTQYWAAKFETVIQVPSETTKNHTPS